MASTQNRTAAWALLAWAALVFGIPRPADAQQGAKYRFYETYTTEASPAPGAIGQAQVAFRETMSSSTETPRGAPESGKLVVQAIYRERPAELAPTDRRRVVAAVRGYDTVRLQPAPRALPSDRPLVEGLTLWYQPVPNAAPELLVLSPGRSMTDQEYLYAARQVFVPDLAYALPDLPVAVGETYSVAPQGMAAILGGVVLDGALTGTLEAVQDDPAGGQVAVFDLVGRGTIDGPRPASVHAQVRFRFTPGKAERPAAVGATAPLPVIDAPGAITRLSLTEQIASPPEAGRLRQTVQRELVLERRVTDPGAPLDLPTTRPEPTIENAWLVYVDPQGRFHVRHPQGLVAQPTGEPDSIEFLQPLTVGGDSIWLALTPREELDPEAIRKDLRTKWEAERVVVRYPSEPGFLPEADWPGRRVYRLEAILMPPGSRPDDDAPRLYFSTYVVQTGRPDGLYVEANSSRPESDPFRALTEAVVRTFEFGKPGQAADPGLNVPSSVTAPAPEPDDLPAPEPPTS